VVLAIESWLLHNALYSFLLVCCVVVVDFDFLPYSVTAVPYMSATRYLLG